MKQSVLVLGNSDSGLYDFRKEVLTALMQEIDLCRTDGYAIENGEYKIGLRSISAPVYTVEGKARYTVGVIGMFRSTRSDEFLAAVEQVCATASMISTALGYRKTEELL